MIEFTTDLYLLLLSLSLCVWGGAGVQVSVPVLLMPS